MRLTIEVSDELARRIRSATGVGSRIALNGFTLAAIANQLTRLERAETQRVSGDLAMLEKQLHKLELGQRAIVALLDPSAKVLASLFLGRGRR